MKSYVHCISTMHINKMSSINEIKKCSLLFINSSHNRTVKLLDRGMNVEERVMEKALQNCDCLQDQNWPEKQAIDVMFILMLEQYYAKTKKLHMYFGRLGESRRQGCTSMCLNG